MDIELLNHVLAVFTAASQVLLALGIVLMFFPKLRNWIINALGEKGLLLAFLVSIFAVALSLFYSEIANFEPCKLCWFQRIFMYPQIILLGIALIKKDFKVVNYALPLAVIGSLFAIYHIYIFYGGESTFPCSAISLSGACTKRYVFELGYITIPLMSLTSFLLLIFSLTIQKLYNKKTSL